MTSYSKFKDYQNRKNISLKYKDLILLKSFLLNQKKDKKIRFKIMLKLNQTYNTLFVNKIVNRCMFSTKVRSVSRLTNSTKAFFSDNLKAGQVCGFKKGS